MIFHLAQRYPSERIGDLEALKLLEFVWIMFLGAATAGLSFSSNFSDIKSKQPHFLRLSCLYQCAKRAALLRLSK